MIRNQIGHVLKKNALLAVLFVFSILFTEPALAAGDQANTALLGLSSILAMIIHILTFLVLMIMSWGGDLIGTTFLTSPDAMEAIRPMWVFIRNLVNISFVLVLLFLAFANLFSSLSGGQGNWTIKDKLPRVIIALIAVNFSLLIFRVAIDAVHVGTITILSITDTVMEEKQAYSPTAILNAGINNTTYEKCSPVLDKDASKGSPNATEGGSNRCLPFYRYVEHALCPGGKADSSDCLIRFTDDVKDNKLIKASSSTEQNIFWAFGTYFQKLELLPILAGKLNSLTGVVTSTLFSAIMAIMYAVAWVAIFIALAVRIVMLWFFMILSPALIAAQVMGFGSGSLGDVQKRLVTNLIMPIKIAAAFALSFVMIATMIKVSPDLGTTVFEPGKALKPFWGVSTNPFGIMWQVMTIIVFWMAVWWALSGTEAEKITGAIKTGAEKTGGYVGSWALDRVRLPAVEGQRGASLLSLGQVGNIMDMSKRQRTRDSQKALNDLIKPGSGAGLAAWGKMDTWFSNNDLGSVKNIKASGTFTGEAILAAPSGELERILKTEMTSDAVKALGQSMQMGKDASDPEAVAKQLRTYQTEKEIDTVLRNAGLMGAASPAAPVENNTTNVDIAVGNVNRSGELTVTVAGEDKVISTDADLRTLVTAAAADGTISAQDYIDLAKASLKLKDGKDDPSEEEVTARITELKR